MVRDKILGSLDDIKFVSIEAEYNGRWTLCLHKNRKSWECPGGHVEEGEMPLAAARRELYEETGAVDYDILPVWDYEALNDDGTLHNNGRVYYVNIRSFGELPCSSEMERIDFFETLPQNVTYNRENMLEMLRKAKRAALAHYE